MKFFGLFVVVFLLAVGLEGHPAHDGADRFRQLDELLPDPSAQRAANGAPGPEYWQQQVDYVIAVTLDDEGQRLTGSETIRYTNNSPLELSYLWLQLDQNRFRREAPGHQAKEAPDFKKFSYRELSEALERETFEGGFELRVVKDGTGRDLPYVVVETMMRVDLPKPLAPGEQMELQIGWEYNIVNAKHLWARGGYEYFEEDGNYLYTIAQWHPRLAAFTDVNGWQHKQFLGRGEFALEFGNFEVSITVPADHLVAATGELQNWEQMLSVKQRERLKRAEGAEKPVFIVTKEEAEANEHSRSKEMKTWIFKAEKVRDFAWASSRKFLWDAAQIEVGGRPVWAMSFYPKEGEPLWSKYSTHAIMHTLAVYSRQVFPYPYPVAISVHGPVFGMEYPMICFNGPRPEEDGTYTRRTKYGLISVVIHEVGHNWFPMIVNSDERQWTWMDEGLNSFVQFLAEQEWEERYQSRGGHAPNIVEYMRSPKKVPIMTNSESILQFGSNAYAKPATALNILRETILGRETFDFAFREYARRWKFKRPMPADFFRTMEDASGVDLDWFWHGWFYTTRHVDLGIGSVHLYDLDSRDPELVKAKQRQEKREEADQLITNRRNEGIARYVDRFPELEDFYNANDEFVVTDKDRKDFAKLLEELEPRQRELLQTERYFQAVEFLNPGGLVMPLILKIVYEDGEETEERIPAEIWKKDAEAVTRLFVTKKRIVSIELDPHLETSDVDRSNNHWPGEAIEAQFQLTEREQSPNLMQQLRQEKEDAEAEAEAKSGEEQSNEEQSGEN